MKTLHDIIAESAGVDPAFAKLFERGVFTTEQCHVCRGLGHVDYPFTQCANCAGKGYIVVELAS